MGTGRSPGRMMHAGADNRNDRRKMTVPVARIVSFILCALVVLMAPLPSPAADGRPAAAGTAAIPLVHTSWLVKDGAPQGAIDIAQTPDGWIWVSSPVGLFRFDGVRFTRYQPPPGQVAPVSTHRMGVLNDGTLWVTTRFSGLYLIKDDRIRHFEADRDNFPLGAMGDVVRDDAGRIWIASWSGLFSLAPGDTTWRDMNAKLGLPETPVTDLLFDRRGTMWALAPKAIYARRKDEAQFRKIAGKTGRGRLAQAPDGSIWSTDLNGKGVRQLWAERNDAKYAVLRQKEFNAFNFLIDRLGNFWLPRDNGVTRVEFGTRGASVQKYTSRQGLSGATVNTVFEDREGNVWVLTDSGIDQFRASRMHLLSLPHVFGDAQAVAAGPDGDFWVGLDYYRHADGTPQPSMPRQAQKEVVTSLYRDPRGGVWFGTQDALWKLEGGRRVRVPLPPELQTSPSFTIYGLTMDADGALWMNFDLDVWRFKDGIWQKHGNVPRLHGFAAYAMAAGPDRTVWLGSTYQGVLILRDGAVQELGQSAGLDIGAVMQIVPYGKGAYISGENGLVFYDGKRVIRIRGEHDEMFPSTSGLVVMPNGDLWANGGTGLIGIRAADIARVIREPDHRVSFHRFDESDGLIGTATPSIPVPSLVRTTANDLIVSTTSGAFRFSPDNAANGNAPFPVEIIGVTTGGRTHAPSPGLTLNAAPDTVRIDYTALRFTLPHRVRFRYMLEGFDRQWQDAETRRSAFYTGLPPGTYRFKVTAANEDGVWTDSIAGVTFEIPPPFVQTGWFKLMCLAGLVVLGWLLHRFRLRIALRRLSARIEARTAERERIARDLHDTLLQSVQGLIHIFGGIVERVSDADPLKAAMRRALGIAARVMDEGRDKVQGLRTTVADHNELAATLDDFGRSLATLHGIAFAMTLHGRPRPLDMFVHDEIAMIGREAIQNAFAHAQASAISVDLSYGNETIELRVTDDGRGIAPDEQTNRPGHWGMQGMRERAAQLGAALELTSTKGHGTTWRLRVPVGRDNEHTGKAGQLARDVR